jgi:MFS family permease
MSHPTSRATWSLRTAFWLAFGAQVLMLAGSNLPTPLFPLYERHFGFGSGVVTLLFAVYAAALIPSLLTLGRLADRIGRRPVLAAGIAGTALSSLAFASARSVEWLYAGEVLYGIAGGMIMSCAPVAVRELHPKGSVAGGALAATFAASVGLTLGPLGSGELATVTRWPTTSPFVVDIVLALALALALLRIPETRPDVAPPVHRAPVINVPREIRAEFTAAALASAAGWMTMGWVFALSPSFLHEELGVHLSQPFVSGLFAALVVATNGVAQLSLRHHHDSPFALQAALAAMGAGVGAIVASTLTGGLPLALVGAVLAGIGTGVAQMHTMATIQRIAPVHARGGVTSAFLTACYLALSLPVVVAGLTADRVGLGVVSGWYEAVLLTLVGLALVVGVRVARAGALGAEAAVVTPWPDGVRELDALEPLLGDLDVA